MSLEQSFASALAPRLPNRPESSLAHFARRGYEFLEAEDPDLFGALTEEYARQQETLMMVASCCPVDPSVLACESTVPVNVTAEGYPGRRYHAGCSKIDVIESLAIERAKAAFKACYANVQSHSATTANYAVMSQLLRAGDRILGMELNYGGHLTHGAKVAFSGQYFESYGYGLDSRGRIDYEQVERLAEELRPALIICGCTSYPRQVDFRRFRRIADRVGALLLADISHIAGLVITGLHPSPIDEAHVTTTCTHKQLYGPRGGLILMGRDAESVAPRGDRTLREAMQRAVFPFFQGAPVLNAIAAKARALARAMDPEYLQLMKRVVEDSQALADELLSRGYHVVTGGSDNHITLLGLEHLGMSGLVAEEALEAVGIVVNKNRIPGDTRAALVTSGVRLGTNTMAHRGLGPGEVRFAAGLLDRVLRAVRPISDREYILPEEVRREVRAEVARLMLRFPIPRYPTDPAWLPPDVDSGLCVEVLPPPGARPGAKR